MVLQCEEKHAGANKYGLNYLMYSEVSVLAFYAISAQDCALYATCL